MPTYKEIHITTGWKNEANKRFGPAVVILHKDVKTGKTLFQDAPTLEDELFYQKFFSFLKTYDKAIKDLRGLNGGGVSCCGVDK